MPDTSGWLTTVQIAAAVGTGLGIFVMTLLGRRTRFSQGLSADDDETARLREQLREQELAIREQRVRQEIREEFFKRLEDEAEYRKQDYVDLEQRVRSLELIIAGFGQSSRLPRSPGK